MSVDSSGIGTSCDKRSVTDVLNGSALVLPVNAKRQATLTLIETTLLESIEAIAGQECARAVRQAGLKQMHHFFPRKYLPRISEYLTRKTGKHAIRMGYDTMVEDFGFKDEFYVEATLAYRIHYPNSSSRAAGAPSGARNPQPAAKSPAAPAGALSFRPAPASDYRGLSINKPYEDGHAPHRDYWFGYALHTLNLWWAIEDVDESNGMILYPETNVKKLSFETKGRPYLDRWTILTRPQYTPLKRGEMLVISSHTLHATNLNTSDHTRLVLSVRITPGTPRFVNEVMSRSNAAIHRGKFHPSTRIADNDYETVVDFTGSSGHAAEDKSETVPQYCPRVSVDSEVEAIDTFVCDASVLGKTKRIHASARNVEVSVFQTTNGLRALCAVCPHEKYNLSSGFCDDNAVVCPGHGLKFDLATGKSATRFTAEVFPACERDGKIFLRRSDKVQPSSPSESSKE